MEINNLALKDIILPALIAINPLYFPLASKNSILPKV